jgi:hypothetical protein
MNYYNVAWTFVFITIIWLFIGINGYFLAKFIKLDSLYGVSNTLAKAIGLKGGPMLMYRVMTSPACTEFAAQVALEADGDMAKSVSFRRWCIILLSFTLAIIGGVIFIALHHFTF